VVGLAEWVPVAAELEQATEWVRMAAEWEQAVEWE
jgi:hypothetical protein